MVSNGPGDARSTALCAGGVRGRPAVAWSDQCRSSARITEVVRHRFGVEYTLSGLDLLLHGTNWSVQMPKARLERMQYRPGLSSERVSGVVTEGGV
ncbi:winged helix-turn-helix domain-containing protein [Streptomyces sp. NPDC007905]|uniref:winged helix-turn-helix domain-containing protein n=1 Tax=Streptomyces sp. NPDC007905 TaxID=3364788 RepID=UPI0036EF2E49